MTDKINVTIECGGYTITGEAGADDATVIAIRTNRRLQSAAFMDLGSLL